MENYEKSRSLEEIRAAQLEIASLMSQGGLAPEEQTRLEKASAHLRNLERMLLLLIGKELVAGIKSELLALKILTAEMKESSDRLFRINDILKKIIKVTGKVLDILDILK